MKTRVYRENELSQIQVKEDIKQTLLSGGNVIFPTETVYGIGAYALSTEGVEGIYRIKGRPSDNPLIMHVNNENDILPFIVNQKQYVKKLMDTFWPGPLTMVFEKSELVPLYITGGLNTVAIRIPSNDIARYVIETAGVPVCAPSANISGRPSSTLFEHVLEDFNDRVDIIIDGGKSQIGLESTVLDVTGDIPIVLRPGMITSEMIKEVVGDVKIAHPIKQSDIPKSPGMKYKHYAPKGKLTIIEGKSKDVVNYINEQIKLHHKDNKKVGVITTSEYKNQFDTEYVSPIGGKHNEVEIASNLFLVLREMDQRQVDFIYSMSFHKGTYHEAIMNRLYKAANNRIVKL